MKYCCIYCDRKNRRYRCRRRRFLFIISTPFKQFND